MSQVVPEPTPEAAQQAAKEAVETAADQILETPETETLGETLEAIPVPENSTIMERLSILEQKLDAVLTPDEPDGLEMMTPAAVEPETVTETEPENPETTVPLEVDDAGPGDQREVGTSQRRGLFRRR